MTLDQAPRGDQLRIDDITGDTFLIERLREIGVHPGASVQVVRRLPFSGAHVVRLGEIDVALRAEEARCIRIQKA